MEYILIIGGAGYIGQFVCKFLKSNGYIPITYDNLSTGHKEAVKWGPFIYGDLLDKSKLSHIFSKYRFTSVIHLAGVSESRESILNPTKYYQNNLAGMINLLEIMSKHHVKSLIFSSTAAVYGNNYDRPINEQDPVSPQTPYAKSKYFIEQILKDYENSYGLKSIILRYFNAAGADIEVLMGENHQPETHVIPLLIQAALGWKSGFTLNGNTFATEDKTAIRDFIHVLDLSSAHIKALRYVNLYKKSAIFNLGSGIGFSIKQLIGAVEAFSKKSIPINIKDRMKNDPDMLLADITKAKKALVWTPEYSDLPTLIKSAWKWQKKILKQKVIG